jgi:hypothetical protein
MAFGNKNQQDLYNWLDDALKTYKTERVKLLSTIVRVQYNALKREKVAPIFTQPDFPFFIEAQLILNQLSYGRQNSENTIIKHDKWKTMAELKTFSNDFIAEHMKEMKRPVGSIMSKVIRILKDSLQDIYDTGVDNVAQLNFLWDNKTNIWFFRFKNAVLLQAEADAMVIQIEKHGLSGLNTMFLMDDKLKRYIYNRFCRAIRAGSARMLSDDGFGFWKSIMTSLGGPLPLIKNEEEWDSMKEAAKFLIYKESVLPDKPEGLQARKS